MPEKLEGLVQSHLQTLHLSFIKSSEYREVASGSSETRDKDLRQAFHKFKETILRDDMWDGINIVYDGTEKQELYSLTKKMTNYFWVIPVVHEYEWVGADLDSHPIVYRFSLHSFHQAISVLKYEVFMITLLICAFLVLIGYYLLFKRNIFIPVQNLSRVSSSYVDGNLNARVKVERRDELGQVGIALNTMARQIQEKEKKLMLTIQSLKAANEELETTKNEQLQIEKLASVGRLAAGVAHEVGNPLGAISGYVDILRSALKKEEAKYKQDIELCDRIEEETHRISKIIRALLRQARPPQERIKPVKLKSLIEKAVSLAQIPSGTDLFYEFEDEMAEVSVEADQLTQVLINLLINAKHAIEQKTYSSSEKPNIKIRCHLRRLSSYSAADDFKKDEILDSSIVRSLKPIQYWVTNIEDNGIGISTQNQKKLFEPFFSTKDTGKGTGLGLYVSKSIIESFRGAIVVRSAEGYGTDFSIFLPLPDSV